MNMRKFLSAILLVIVAPCLWGQEYVDLGLPSGTKWATYNIGANFPEEYGYYFAWGETSPKSTYGWDTYKLFSSDGNYTLTKYIPSACYGIPSDNKIVLEECDDAAYVNWGEDRRIPTIEEFGELMSHSNCSWRWTSFNGVNGYKVRSKRPGYTDKFIFLPAAGYRDDDESGLVQVGDSGCYWTSTLCEGFTDTAYDVRFSSTRFIRYCYQRTCGRSIRPVLAADPKSRQVGGWVQASEASLGSYVKGDNGYRILQNRLPVKKIRVNTSSLYGIDGSDLYIEFQICSRSNPGLRIEFNQFVHKNGYIRVNSSDTLVGKNVGNSIYEFDFSRYGDDLYLWGYQFNFNLHNLEILVDSGLKSADKSHN